MKILLFLGALLLSSAPASADDLLYLKCDEKRVLTSTVSFGEGEQVPLKSDSEELFVLSIDAKNKKMLVNRSEVDIVIKNGEAIHADVFDNGNVRDARVVSTMLSPPYARYGQGKVVSQEPFLHITDVVIRADCVKIDWSEFDEFLN